MARGKKVLARLFGLLAVMFGTFYLAEGVSWLRGLASGTTSRDLFWAHYQIAAIVFDFFVGGGSTVAGAGMLLRMDWGRKAWLAMLAVTLAFHFLVTLANRTIGFDVHRSYGWVGMVCVLAVVSWVILTRPGVRARFR